MKSKKIAIAGAVALVVIGCVLAAGCTSTQTTSDPIVGTWGIVWHGEEEGIHFTTFLADGNGNEVIKYVTGTEATYPFTWKKTGDNTYQLNYEDGEIWEATYTDPDTNLIWKEVKSTPDTIVGTHSATYTDSEGKTVKVSSVYKGDQTGIINLTLDDQKTESHSMTWIHVGTNRYIVISEDGERWIVTYTPGNPTYKKIEYSGEPVIGSEIEKIIVNGTTATVTNLFKVNGTGVEITEYPSGIKEEYPYVWEKTAENTYLVSYLDDAPFEQWIVKYNPEDKSQDWSLSTILWVNNYAGTDGHVVDANLVHKNLDKGIAVEYHADGTSNTHTTTWSSDHLGVFTITYDDGTVWTATWNPSTQQFDWNQTK